MKITQCILFLICFTSVGLLSVAQNDAYKKQLYIESGETLPYRILLPKNFDPSKRYPLILFLHGSGERGSDNEAQLIHGSKLFLNDSIRDQYPAIVVFPQCPTDSYWSNVNIKVDSTTRKRVFTFAMDGPPTNAMKLLPGLLNELEKNYKLDSKRRYVGGLSMGGM